MIERGLISKLDLMKCVINMVGVIRNWSTIMLSMVVLICRLSRTSCFTKVELAIALPGGTTRDRDG